MIINEQQNYQNVKRLFEQGHGFEFESEAQEKRYVEYTLRAADSLYRDEHHYREYPQFERFLNTHHVDAIVYGVVEGEYEVN